MSIRSDKVRLTLKKAVSEIIKIEHNFDYLVSVSDLDISPDLSNVKIYISVLGDNESKENVIDETNAQEIRARLIVEAANGPITFEADEILNKRNITIIPDIMANAGGVAVSYFEWIRNIRHIRFGRLEKRRNAFQFETLIAAIETMTGKDMPEKFKEQFIEGANEIDLVRSGLDDMMREAYQKVRQSMIENKIPNLRTAAYKVALDRIAISYDTIGL